MVRRNISAVKLRLPMIGIHCRFTLDVEHSRPGAR
jgi:hypothetical protein